MNYYYYSDPPLYNFSHTDKLKRTQCRPLLKVIYHHKLLWNLTLCSHCRNACSGLSRLHYSPLIQQIILEFFICHISCLMLILVSHSHIFSSYFPQCLILSHTNSFINFTENLISTPFLSYPVYLHCTLICPRFSTFSHLQSLFLFLWSSQSSILELSLTSSRLFSLTREDRGTHMGSLAGRRHWSCHLFGKILQPHVLGDFSHTIFD